MSGAIEARRQRNAGKVVPIRPDAREAYRLDPVFLQACSVHAAGHAGRRFWLEVGHAVEPDLLPDPRAKTVFETVRLIRAESANPPGSVVATVQRLTRALDLGKMTQEHFEACVEYLSDLDAASIPDVDDACAQLRPVVTRKIIEQKAAPAMIEAVGTGDTRAARKHLDAIERLAAKKAEAAVGDDWEAADAANEAVAKLPKFQTGLGELDALIGGGITKGLVTKVIAGTGVGKSPTLVHFGAEALWRGMFVVHVSLQDHAAYVWARYKANLLDAPFDEVLADPQMGTRLVRQLHPNLGRLRVREFPAGHTTPRDVFDAVEAEEKAAGMPVSAVVLDYGGKLKPSGIIEREGKTHRGVEAIALELEEYAKATNQGHGHPGGPIWIFDGAQAKRKSTSGSASVKTENVRRRPLDNDDVAGGMAEVRDAGFVLTLNRAREDEFADQTYYAFVSKNKLGPVEVGCELTPNLGHARIHVLSHR